MVPPREVDGAQTRVYEGRRNEYSPALSYAWQRHPCGEHGPGYHGRHRCRVPRPSSATKPAEAWEYKKQNYAFAILRLNHSTIKDRDAHACRSPGHGFARSEIEVRMLLGPVKLIRDRDPHACKRSEIEMRMLFKPTIKINSISDRGGHACRPTITRSEIEMRSLID